MSRSTWTVVAGTLAAGAVAALAAGPMASDVTHALDGLQRSDSASAEAPPAGDWPVYASDAAATHYSPLDEITPANVQRLTQVWEWKPGKRRCRIRHAPRRLPEHAADDRRRPLRQHALQPGRRARRGDGRRTLALRSRGVQAGQPASGQGFVHRGLAAWRDGDDFRIFLNSRDRLIALDARTGRRIPAFGKDGEVPRRGADLVHQPRPLRADISPVIYRNLVIVGNGVGIGSAIGRIRRATSARSTRGPAGASGPSTPFHSRVNSATTPGTTARGASRATPTCGRR
ncbi:MAG: hypothetical protein R2712_15740 [Vicinamibacterales bacterium]